MKYISFDHVLWVRKGCPMCGANEKITANGWVIDDGKYPRKLKKELKKNGKWPLWIGESFDIECSKEPDIGSKKWDEWWLNHDTPHPYIDIMPHHTNIENSILREYRYFERGR